VKLAALGLALAQVLAALAMAPGLAGLVVRVKALVAGRRGAPLVQPYRDLAKLARKATVLPAGASAAFLAGPAAALATAVAAALFVPLAFGDAPLAFAGDAIVFVYVLALGRFLLVLSALDAGSAFEGMGASREVAFAALVEPALLLALAALARSSGSLSLSGMLSPAGEADLSVVAPVVVLAAGALFLALLAECSRLPFDDPATHLELTMIHEVMVLDQGGPALGWVLYGGMVKLLLLAAVVARLPLLALGDAVPPGARAALFVGLLVAVAVAVGVAESSMARLRLLRVPQLLVTANLLAGFALLVALRG
jgi:formate hydrogenlyase subunit 4